MKDYRHELFKCPTCGHSLDASTAITGQMDHAPQDGDFCICINCVEALEMAGGKLVLVTEAREAELSAEDRQNLTGMRYAMQVGIMAYNAKEWRRKNPGRTALVQFSSTERVAVIGPISDALAQHFVSTNEAGLELLKAMWPRWDSDSREPTVFMCKMALEGPPKGPKRQKGLKRRR